MPNTNTVISIKTAPAGRGLYWLLDAFTIVWKNWLAWIGVTAFLIILTLLSNVVPVIGGLVLQLIFPVFIGGLMLGCQAADQGNGFTFEYLFSGFTRRTGQLLVIGVIHLLGIMIILVICGLMLVATMGGIDALMEVVSSIYAALVAIDINRMIELVGPLAQVILLVELIGLALYIPLLVLVWFAPALIVLENMNAITAMKVSFTGCLKNIIPYLVYGMVGLIFTVIATIPLGLGWLVLMPMFIASIYLSFKDIFQKTEFNW